MKSKKIGQENIQYIVWGMGPHTEKLKAWLINRLALRSPERNFKWSDKDVVMRLVTYRASARKVCMTWAINMCRQASMSRSIRCVQVAGKSGRHKHTIHRHRRFSGSYFLPSSSTQNSMAPRLTHVGWEADGVLGLPTWENTWWCLGSGRGSLLSCNSSDQVLPHQPTFHGLLSNPSFYNPNIMLLALVLSTQPNEIYLQQLMVAHHKSCFSICRYLQCYSAV